MKILKNPSKTLNGILSFKYRFLDTRFESQVLLKRRKDGGIFRKEVYKKSESEA